MYHIACRKVWWEKLWGIWQIIHDSPNLFGQILEKSRFTKHLEWNIVCIIKFSIKICRVENFAEVAIRKISEVIKTKLAIYR